ncbi:MAG: GNAT family N-acetyltransferase [Cohaesibacter sp.]|nr:GNAT family N-acetyltransferase [Cohaesibacter sp.]
MSDFVMRLAVREDVPALVDMLTDDFLGKSREDLNNLAPYYAAFDDMQLDRHNKIYVFEADGLSVAGTLQLIYMQGLSVNACKRAEIEAVRVHKSLRGQGWGKKMFAWAIEKARADGCGILQLTSNKARVDGQRFYEQVGFEQSHVGYKLLL